MKYKSRPIPECDPDSPPLEAMEAFIRESEVKLIANVVARDSIRYGKAIICLEIGYSLLEQSQALPASDPAVEGLQLAGYRVLAEGKSVELQLHERVINLESVLGIHGPQDS